MLHFLERVSYNMCPKCHPSSTFSTPCGNSRLDCGFAAGGWGGRECFGELCVFWRADAGKIAKNDEEGRPQERVYVAVVSTQPGFAALQHRTYEIVLLSVCTVNSKIQLHTTCLGREHGHDERSVSVQTFDFLKPTHRCSCAFIESPPRSSS